MNALATKLDDYLADTWGVSVDFVKAYENDFRQTVVIGLMNSNWRGNVIVTTRKCITLRTAIRRCEKRIKPVAKEGVLG